MNKVSDKVLRKVYFDNCKKVFIIKKEYSEMSGELFRSSFSNIFDKWWDTE